MTDAVKEAAVEQVVAGGGSPSVGNVRVICFAGTGRSGSTLLARLLGAVPGFVTIGEGVAYLLDPRIRARDIPCGCGRPVSSCVFWTGIDALAEPGDDGMVGLIRLRSFRRWLGASAKGDVRLLELARRAERLYREAAARTGAQVVVDSSKNPAFVHLLAAAEAVELHVVHLVRDPRGFVSSRRRAKAYLGRLSTLRAIGVWVARNLAAEASRSRAATYRMIRYEEFVTDPGRFLGQIAREVTGVPVPMDFIRGSEAEVGLQHFLAGNPDKLRAGRVQVRAREWSLPAWVQAVVVACTWPLMLRYGIPMRSHA